MRLWTGFKLSGKGPVTGSYALCKKPSCSRRNGELFDYLRDYQLLNEDSDSQK